MRRLFHGLVAAALVTLAATPLAAAAPAAKARTHSVVGTLQRFDSTGRMLTLATGKGSMTLPLAASAQIHEGTRTIAPGDLSSHTGSRVKVWYSENHGRKTAEEVRLVAASPGTATKAKK
jgi:hypothetical protein